MDDALSTSEPEEAGAEEHPVVGEEMLTKVGA